MTTQGNLDQVRAALHGITGVDPQRREQPAAADWFMIVVRSNRELDAIDSMRRHGYRAYWPSYEKLIATKRQFEGRPIRRLVRVGVIPYIFSPATDSLDLVGLREEIVAVIDLARTDTGKPLLLRHADIEKIRRIEFGQNGIKPENPKHDFKIGEKVRLVDDVTSDWPPGKIIKLAPDGRISIEVMLMGRKVPISVLPFQIKRT
jgi:hypothetical protein